MGQLNLQRTQSPDTTALAQRLARTVARLDARASLAATLSAAPGKVCAVSAFGADSAIILHMLSELAPDTPVLLLDTGFLFQETHAYRRALTQQLKLTDVRSLAAGRDALQALDARGDLHRHDPDRCCKLRKAAPLNAGLSPFKVWITGRKRAQGGARSTLAKVETQDDRVKLNPLVDWSTPDIQAYFERFDLPRHPLIAKGYRSIGCAPCTQPVDPGASERSGRWAGRDKSECGIHIGANGQMLRSAMQPVA